MRGWHGPALVGLALFLTVFIMEPTLSRLNNEAVLPYMSDQITGVEAFRRGTEIHKQFMLRQTRKHDLALFVHMSKSESISQASETPISVLIPAFIISELKTAFFMGFCIYVPFLLVDMDQPGVEVRPIEMMSGDSEFNEVFFTDARVPKENVIGGVNNGWAVAMTLLGYERGEAAATLPIRFQAEVDRLFLLAKERGVADDPRIRQRLAQAYAKVQIMRFSGMRVLTRFLQGHHPGPDAAISKL